MRPVWFLEHSLSSKQLSFWVKWVLPIPSRICSTLHTVHWSLTSHGEEGELTFAPPVWLLLRFSKVDADLIRADPMQRHDPFLFFYLSRMIILFQHAALQARFHAGFPEGSFLTFSCGTH